MGYSRVFFKVTAEEIARASGKSIYTVHRHIKKGILDAGDLGSVHRWVLRYGKVVETEGGSG